MPTDAMQSLRGRAFGKLAALATTSAHTSPTPDLDFARLCDACPAAARPANGAISGTYGDASATGKVPMSLRELEVLLALCEAAPAIQDVFSANRFIQQTTPYVAESCYQAIAPSPFLQNIRPSPWEILSFRLVDSTLRLSVRHPSLRDPATSSLNAYVESCKRLSRHLSRAGPNEISIDPHGGASQESLSVLILAASLLGFLEAAAATPGFWRERDQNKLLITLQDLLSSKFLLNIEGILSSLRNVHEPSGAVKEWKQYLKNYASSGRPFGAIALQQAFAHVVQAMAAPLALSTQVPAGVGILDYLMEKLASQRLSLPVRFDSPLLETLATISSQEIVNVDEGSDYLQLGSAWQQRLGHSVKATSLVTFLCCSLANDEIAEQDVLLSWLETSLDDPQQAGDEELASVILKSMAILSTISTGTASSMCRSIQRFLIGGSVPAEIASVAATSLLFVLKLLPQDTTITTLYSLGNSISGSNNTEVSGRFALFNDTSMGAGSPTNGVLDEKAPSLKQSPSLSVEQPTDTYNSTVSAIVIIAKGYGDDKIMELALSMLIQKVGKVNKAVDLKIITEAAALASQGGGTSLRPLLRLYNRLHQDGVARNDQLTIRAVSDARDFLSMTLKGGSDLYELYFHDLLETIVRKGEVTPTKHTNASEFESATLELALLLRPLALLILHNLDTPGIQDVESFPALQRDAWYNIVVHGFTVKSLLSKRYVGELEILAKYSRPLIDEDLANKLESDIDLNTVLRRGKHSDNKSRAQSEMVDLLPSVESEIKSLSYPELMFLKAAYIVETMRASTGLCTRVMDYFIDPQLRGSDLGKCMRAMALKGIDIYLRHALGVTRESFFTPEVAIQLSLIFEGCCHRVADVQDIAYACVERILGQIPSALCQRASLFALLDLLTIMWTSCLESETDEYEWKSLHKAPHGETRLRLSDNYTFRRATLRKFHQHAKNWVEKATNIAPLDVKGLLQTYLSDFSDDEAFGHLSLGRSFAFDMGAMIPLTDQRLGAIEREDNLHINTASDFMSHYTTRQEYRFTDPLRTQDMRMANGLSLTASSDFELSKPAEILAALANMESQLLKREFVAMSRVRDLLRRAASLLCRVNGDQASVAAHFVRIPFLLFSKQIIKFGLSLWMGVIKENPDMESRILVEIIEGWITTVRGKLGIFNKRMTHVDPFFLKMEYAPTDKEANMKQQQRAHDLIAPHFRVLQFLSSHYTATRLNNGTIEDDYLRFLKITLKGLRTTAGHPLAREVHFHIVFLGLKVLRNCTSLDATARWRLKDDLLSAGLAWFAHPPRWSFGGNRLQIKAETQLLGDVASTLSTLSSAGTHVPSPLKSLQGKQELLLLLIGDEITRLLVWLFPLDHTKRHTFGGHTGRPSPEAISSLLRIAWDEEADLALNIATRFKSERLDHEIRWYILNFPEKAMDNPDALQLLFQSRLPNDVSSQLKYLAYWAPVNPITASTFFMPAYGNHPCIIQYAVRALESHSVDVTFFYVPQIVQTLRYDALGYVARYIIETANFSQLFAHQIIWNMKANAFKDEESEIPDPVKPTLDIVMDKLISSFSGDDRAFYEREFFFFSEITGISGKLKPFIKKSKPEKKQKIEDELRQIQLEVGVYLPSNPDGVVVGIDRKSGKPLQSHAKAPYMATFRIRKEKSDDMENTEEQLAAANESSNKDASASATFEVWQSAIFKVGDDCRQDVLALQLISAFRGIFHFVGLPVYVFPNRVTATAPGCGVIDVLPNSISRDMLGREAVNGLMDWFLATFGSQDSPAFQLARNNFVKSLAAYSVISYLLQFKDRHNGNIMYDDQGHILHIDFGFCFDIAPGGVKFERAPFKLTKEMISVLGGSMDTQPFRWFEELCVKAFLAARPFFEQLSNLVLCMLDSGLPCFKPETMQNLRDRFVLDKTEREAAEYMKGLVHKSYGALSTKGYDQFQLLTNGIPY